MVGSNGFSRTVQDEEEKWTNKGKADLESGGYLSNHVVGQVRQYVGGDGGFLVYLLEEGPVASKLRLISSKERPARRQRLSTSGGGFV